MRTGLHRLLPVLALLSFVVPLPAAAQDLKKTIAYGRAASVDHLQFSADGQSLFAAAGSGGECKVWEVATGKPLGEFKAGDSYFSQSRLALRPDAQSLLLITDGGTMLRWDLATHKKTTKFLAWGQREVEGKTFRALAMSPDGKVLATGNANGSVELWDTASRQRTAFFRGEPDSLGDMIVSPKGKYVACPVRGEDAVTALRVWEVATGKPVATLKTACAAFRFSADDKHIAGFEAAHGADDKAWVWDVAAGKLIREFFQPLDPVRDAALAPDGKTLVTVGEDEVRGWDLGTGKVRFSIPAKSTPAHFLLSPDGKILAQTAPVNGKAVVEIWDLATGNVRAALAVGGNGTFPKCQFTPDGQRLLTWVAGTKTIKLWNVAQGQLVATLTYGLAPEVVFSPDGKWLALNGQNEERISVWDAVTGKYDSGLSAPLGGAVLGPGANFLVAGSPSDVRLWEVDGARPLVTVSGVRNEGITVSFVFSPDGKTLAVGTGSNVHVWSIPLAKEIASLEGAGPHRQVAYSPDGKTLILRTDRAIALWDTGERRLREFLPQAHTDAVIDLAFSPDGKWLASAAADRTVKLWDLQKKTYQRTVAGSAEEIVRVSFSPDGKKVATLSKTQLHLWTVPAGKELLAIQPNLAGIFFFTALTFHPNGKTVTTAYNDGEVRYWDMADGTSNGRRHAHNSTIRALAYNADGSLLATGAANGEIKLWSFKP